MTDSGRVAHRRGADERAVLRLVAELYYERGLSQQDIAELTGFSVSKVSRLHRQAREAGIVQITVQSDDRGLQALAGSLGAALELEVHVTAGVPTAPLRAARLCGAAAALFVAGTLPEDGVVGWASGVTTEALVSSLPAVPRPDLTHVPLIGGWDSHNPSLDTNSLVRSAAERTGGQARVLNAPAVLDSVELKARLLAESGIAAVARMWEEVRLAVIGVSGMPQTRPDYRTILDRVNEDVRAELIELGVVGDVVGHFFDVRGSIVDHVWTDRSLAMSLPALKGVPRVLAVLAGSNKVDSLLGLARTRLVHTIVTDSVTATAVLDRL